MNDEHKYGKRGKTPYFMQGFKKRDWGFAKYVASLVLGFTLLTSPVLFFPIFIPSVVTDDAGTRKLLIQNGFTPVKVGGWAGLFAGDRSDWYRTKFVALTAKGDTVKGCVTEWPFHTWVALRIKLK